MKPHASVVSRPSSLPWRVALAVGALAFAGFRGLAQDANQPSFPSAAVVDKPLLPPSNDVPDDQPSLQHVWIPGHWRWGQGSYIWVAGRWQVPPMPNTTWVAPQWLPQGTGYALRDGFWQQNPPPVEAAGGQPANEISTPQPPPPSKPEAIPEQPSPDHVWQPGYWDWRSGQFVWTNGHWELPPRQNLVWMPAHWETRGNRYVLTAGYWRENAYVPPPATVPAAVAAPPSPPPVVITQPAPAQVIVMAPPPPPPQEIVYRQPSPFHTWVPGFWAWRGGRYVWIAGHWERPPHGRRSWEPPRWERRGGNYVFVEGHWR